MKFEPHPFTLRQLQYVVAVAQTLSFRRAASLCHVAQPSLSAQLALAEEALGVRLFERDRRRVLLTPAGQVLVERAKRLLVDADDLALEGRRASDPMEGTLRIGVIPTVSPYLLPSVTPGLRARFARLTVAWLEEKTETLLEKLEAGAIEAAVLALSPEMTELESDVLADDRFVLVTPPGHRLAKKSTPVALEELRGEVVLLLDDGHCFRDQALELCTSARAQEAEFRATSLSTLTQMVAGGAGVTLLPALAIATETRRAAIHARPIARSPHRTLALVWRKRSPLAVALRAVAKQVRATYPVERARRGRG